MQTFLDYLGLGATLVILGLSALWLGVVVHELWTTLRRS